MRMGRPKLLLILTPEERETLERWARRPKSAQALAQRARIVLVCAQGKANTAVAAELGWGAPTVGKGRARFVARRLDGLLDEPRPGAPRQVTDAQVERVITLTLESTPGKATHGSTRLLARRCGMSQSAVSRSWRAFALQPHRSETFKLPCSSKKSGTSWGCTWTRRNEPWGWGWMRKRRFKLWIARSLCCPCVLAKWSGVLTIRRDTGPPRCSRPWT